MNRSTRVFCLVSLMLLLVLASAYNLPAALAGLMLWFCGFGIAIDYKTEGKPHVQ